LIRYIVQPGTAVHDMCLLKRRGFELGWVREDCRPASPDSQSIVQAWHNDDAICVPGLAVDAIQHHTGDTRCSRELMEKTLSGRSFGGSLESEPLASRLRPHFAMVASSMEEHDTQGIEKVYFDAENEGRCIAEDLWCKASWLSFHDEDASLRFRFSFGMEGYEDVAADPVRQHWAGVLCDSIFPESAAITENPDILTMLQEILGTKPAFVERIVYFNAPNGGAQFHHDVERGHAGVIYAQITGRTFWLAASRPKLIEEIRTFLAQTDANAWQELRQLAANYDVLSAYMEEFDHEDVEALIDRSPAFIRHMVGKGYGFLLHPGDVLLMPQRNIETCVWHSVFCLDDEPGEGLSFALRGSEI